jgi:hypothetical protein
MSFSLKSCMFYLRYGALSALFLDSDSSAKNRSITSSRQSLSLELDEEEWQTWSEVFSAFCVDGFCFAICTFLIW